jgi:beta-phosphoglucomutase
MTFKTGVLWDMDVVLVDTGELHYQSWAGTLANYGIPFSPDLFRRTFGMNNNGILEIVTGRKPEPELLAEISNQKEGWFRASMRGKVKSMPGVLDWLRQLQAWGVGQAVASSAPPANIEAMVDELGIRPYFSTLFSGYDLPGKPDPATFLGAARALGIQPERCLVIEDAIPGVQAAKHAGMACIAVLTTNPREALAQADIITDTLDHLPVDTIWSLIPKL